MDITQSIYESTLHIHSVYAEPITVTDIAAKAYLSPSYFSFIFRTFTSIFRRSYRKNGGSFFSILIFCSNHTNKAHVLAIL